jgi:tripartite-type tricarboxylate transporter receptor subunit TctC
MGFGEYAKAGKVRLLVVFSEERLPEFPDVPTAKELGLKGGTKGPVGMVGPRGLPEDVLKTLAEAFKKAMEDPKYIAAMEKLHQPIDYKGPQEFLKELREYDEWSVNIMKRVGMIK